MVRSQGTLYYYTTTPVRNHGYLIPPSITLTLEHRELRTLTLPESQQPSSKVPETTSVACDEGAVVTDHIWTQVEATHAVPEFLFKV